MYLLYMLRIYLVFLNIYLVSDDFFRLFVICLCFFYWSDLNIMEANFQLFYGIIFILYIDFMTGVIGQDTYDE